MAEPLVRLRVVEDDLLLPVPVDAAAQFQGEHAQQRHVRGAVADLEVADGALAGFDALQQVGPEAADVLVVRLLQQGYARSL